MREEADEKCRDEAEQGAQETAEERARKTEGEASPQVADREPQAQVGMHISTGSLVLTAKQKRKQELMAQVHAQQRDTEAANTPSPPMSPPCVSPEPASPLSAKQQRRLMIQASQLPSSPDPYGGDVQNSAGGFGDHFSCCCLLRAVLTIFFPFQPFRALLVQLALPCPVWHFNVYFAAFLPLSGHPSPFFGDVFSPSKGAGGCGAPEPTLSPPSFPLPFCDPSGEVLHSAHVTVQRLSCVLWGTGLPLPFLYTCL